MKSIIFILLLLSSPIHAQTLYEEYCFEDTETCVVLRTVDLEITVETTSELAFDTIKKEDAEFPILLIDPAASSVITQGPLPRKHISEEDSELFNKALDEFQISTGACAASAGTCVAGIPAAIVLTVKGKFPHAAKAYAAGTLGCILIKPSCRDAIRKFKEFRKIKEAIEKSLAEAPTTPTGGFSDSPAALPDVNSDGHSGPRGVVGPTTSSSIILEERSPTGIVTVFPIESDPKPKEPSPDSIAPPE
ncbi:MAG: hypothetical protein EOP04_22495 [Proteobacteria bacterium]|nr:MAG: hypothetical protein EOP04_22495 [Pseudomonadota bacterium]